MPQRYLHLFQQASVFKKKKIFKRTKLQALLLGEVGNVFSLLLFFLSSENTLRMMGLHLLFSGGTMCYFGLPLITGDSLSRQRCWRNAESRVAIRKMTM